MTHIAIFNVGLLCEAQHIFSILNWKLLELNYVIFTKQTNLVLLIRPVGELRETLAKLTGIYPSLNTMLIYQSSLCSKRLACDKLDPIRVVIYNITLCFFDVIIALRAPYYMW